MNHMNGIRHRSLRFLGQKACRPQLLSLGPAVAFRILLCLMASGCGPPELELGGPGEQVAAGHFRGLEVAGTEDSSGFVLALRDPDPAGGLLTVAPLAGGRSCEVGRVESYRVEPGLGPVGPPSDNTDPRIAFFESIDESGRGVLRFADMDCHRPLPTLEDAESPRYLRPSDGEPAFFARTGAGDVYRLSPWEETSALMASDVSQFRPGYGDLWLVEGGQLVVRDASTGEELARVGSDVREFFLPCSQAEAAFVDATGLYVLQELTEPPVLVGTDACEVQCFYDSFLVFLSPCEQRRLVVHNLRTAEQIAYVEGVGSAKRVLDYHQPPGADWLFYVMGAAAHTTIGELWAVQPGNGPPTRVGSNGDLRWVNPDFEVGFFVLLDWDGEKGRLGVWTPGEGFTEIHGDVAEFFPQWNHIAVLGDYDGTVGTLLVLDDSDYGVKHQASGVPKGDFQFSWEERGLGYIDQYDTAQGVGRLRVYVIPLGQVEEVDQGVSEFLELTWPEWGILYIIGQGDRAGIWFQPVKIDL